MSNSKKPGLSEHPFIAIVSIVASVIAIVTFTTGIPDLPEFIQKIFGEPAVSVTPILATIPTQNVASSEARATTDAAARYTAEAEARAKTVAATLAKETAAAKATLNAQVRAARTAEAKYTAEAEVRYTAEAEARISAGIIARDLLITNFCTTDIEIALSYWTTAEHYLTVGWWIYKSGETALPEFNGENIRSTSNIFYYYAKSTDGRKELRGGYYQDLRGRSLPMRKLKLPLDSSGDYLLELSCP